jgi:hypothetical protein
MFGCKVMNPIPRPKLLPTRPPSLCDEPSSGNAMYNSRNHTNLGEKIVAVIGVFFLFLFIAVAVVAYRAIF